MLSRLLLVPLQPVVVVAVGQGAFGVVVAVVVGVAFGSVAGVAFTGVAGWC